MGRLDKICNFEVRCSNLSLSYIPYDTFNDVIGYLIGADLGEGSGRVASSLITSDKVILKYPRFHYNCVGHPRKPMGFGIAQTIMEGLTCEAYPNKALAKCKLFRIGNIPVLLMEKVDTQNCEAEQWDDENFRDTFYQDFTLDGTYQRGTTAKGKIVCFDYGCEDHCEAPEDVMEFILSLPKLEKNSIKLFEDSLEIHSEAPLFLTN